MTIALAIAGLALAAVSGIPAVALRKTPALAQRASCVTLLAGAALGLAAAVAGLTSGPAELYARWSVPGGALAFRIDGLSAIFLLPVFGIPAAGSIYGLAYHPQAERGGESLRLQIFYGLVTAAMALLVVAANAMLFLAGWEVMALCGFFLVLTEHEKRETQQAAFVYLASAHVGTLALFALFASLGHAAGSFDFARIGAANVPPTAALFVLMVGGFGLKAGLMPLHFWLPGAHAAAPSHVSAIMSGVLLKTGIYGILRVSGLFDTPPLWWGFTVLAIGAVSAVLGVAFALAQHDLKRLLAYHSVENIGIILMGVGLALIGRARHDAALTLLGFAGGALHVVNHALFKALLFLGAGAVGHATGTRDIDHLGGLARAMPRTSALFLIGAVAISGLPPLNGFVSEWLVYLGSLRALHDSHPVVASAVLAAPALALVGGLASACFAKVQGIVFLGAPRSEHVAHAHESPAMMLAPMAVLALCCVLIGLFPAAALGPLRAAAAGWGRFSPAAVAATAASTTASATAISAAAAILLALAAVIFLWRTRRVRAPAESETWGCGYARPTARMQYTGSSFAEMLTLRFGWAFFPRARVTPPRGPFPRHAAFSSHVPDTVLDVALLPILHSATWGAERIRALYRSKVHVQVLMVGLAILGLFAWRFIWW